MGKDCISGMSPSYSGQLVLRRPSHVSAAFIDRKHLSIPQYFLQLLLGRVKAEHPLSSFRRRETPLHGSSSLPDSLDEIAQANRSFYDRPLANSTTGKAIRLFTLKAGAWTDPMEGTLSEVILEPGIEYKALSYTWGDAEEARTITINGRPGFIVTNNLFGALRRLRPMTVWVDQICVNQADILERGQQVSLMGDIYASAHEVYVWLGPCGFTPSRLPEYQGCECVWQKPEAGSASHVGWHSGVDLLRSVPDEQSHWISRMWTFQEFILARHIIMAVGPHLLDIDDLITTLLDGRPYHAIVEAAWRYNWAVVQFGQQLRLLNDLRRSWRTGFESSMVARLPTLLKSTIRRQARDPLDKIYGILGLCKDTGIRPDYALSHQTLYRDVTLKLMEAEESLDCLVWSWRLQQGGAHGWAIDFSQGLRSPPSLIDFAYDQSMRPIDQLDAAHGPFTGYRAGMKSHDGRPAHVLFPSHHVKDDGQVLLVRGVRFGNVSNIWAPGHPARSYLDTYSESVDFQLHTKFKRPIFKESDRRCDREIEYLIITMMSARESFHLGGKQFSTLLDTSRAWMRTLTADSHVRRASQVDDGRYFEEDIFEPGDNRQQALSDVVINLSGRHCFMTENGFPGLAGNGVSKGDIVVVLIGMSIPAILRPGPDSCDRYRLIGECFVSGIMYGEVMDLLAKGDVKEETFKLV